ncbi:hypothetical protein FB45DRAFT_516167 [Roridomyces roridus]|uniref:Uncharacterized protein n=1 Tax=Roridomyces roridus TaxID=1738132 RepID=A0AAD7BYA5_9AGAR|nr:hypothetical protein FB45DRAFT_516167 [Roridomyces roridus]
MKTTPRSTSSSTRWATTSGRGLLRISSPRAAWGGARTSRNKRAQVGFKSFLNITPTVTHVAAPSSSSPGRPASTGPPPPQPTSAAGASFILAFDENPLAEFVELPDEALEGGLWFSNVLCGVLRGALEMVRFDLWKLAYSDNRRFKCKCKPNSYQMYYEETRAQRYGSNLLNISRKRCL